MSMLPIDTDERCPRCGGAFHCGMNDAAPCACTGITLDAGLQQQLRERYTGCLCLRCLQALAGDATDRGKHTQAPPRLPASCD
jgi:hypothetical protein